MRLLAPSSEADDLAPKKDVEPFIGAEADLLTSGEEVYERDYALGGGNNTNSGQARLSYFTARKTESITQVVVYTGSTAAGATPTVCKVGIYEENPTTKDLTLLAATANDTTMFAATFTPYQRSLTSTFSKVRGVRYALAPFVVSTATLPTFLGTTPSGVSSHWGLTPRLSGTTGTGLADLPATLANSNQIFNVGIRIFGLMLP